MRRTLGLSGQEGPSRAGRGRALPLKWQQSSTVPNAPWAARGAPTPGRRHRPPVPTIYSGPLIWLRRAATPPLRPAPAGFCPIVRCHGTIWSHTESSRAAAARWTPRIFTERLPMIVALMLCSGFLSGNLPSPRQQLFRAKKAMKLRFPEGIGTTLRCSWR